MCLRIGAICLLLATSLAIAGGTLESLEVKMEQIGPAPLPYQAMRTRISLKNLGRAEVKGLTLLELTSQLKTFKGPDDLLFYSLEERAGRPIRFDSSTAVSTNHGTQLGPSAVSARLLLKSGDNVSLSAPMCSYQLKDALFLRPGLYTLHFTYRDYTGIYDTNQTVTVQKPLADDDAVFQMLAKDKNLANAYLWSLRGDRPNAIQAGGPATDRMLQGIIDKAPKSSYGNYARLMLARYQMKKTFDRAGGGYKPTPDDITKATAYLDAISNLKGFAFAPEVYLFYKRYSKDPAKVKQAEEILRTEYYDSIERIYDLILTEPWERVQELRKPPAGRAKND